ncbi:hypothetical protein [Thioclava electrotropha]|uniref:Uncharacterized protein n=1 Tax=Thioclava electrotropha TaxID=1549850 RepID=A0ABX6YT52_9RHOB|nr:hypothetical protein [Thioclava electrotropha]QPZ91012.1 hypothetical protein AKL02_008905 [Thioclava electrotropha]
MNKLVLSAVLVFALSACQEEEEKAEETGSATTSTTQSAEPAKEDTATADDGGGAMDEAPKTASQEPAATQAATSSEVSQEAIDACIDAVRAAHGAMGGTVLSTEFSEANSLVMLKSADDAEWRCLVSNDGSGASVEQVSAPTSTEDSATADDGGGAMDGAPAEEPATADDGGGAMDGAPQESGMPSVGSPTDLTDFVGAPAGQAEGGLQALGFDSIRSEGLTTFWFNRETGACAKITTSDGKFSEITMLPAEDC